MTEPHEVAVDVVVPTYRRPADLARCLSAIGAQTRSASQIIVVAREDDVESHEVVRAAAEHHPCLRLTVGEPGVIAAMSSGVAATTAPIVAFTDDDAAPHRDWLARLLGHFQDPTVGAVGGRDVIAGQTEPRLAEVGVFRPSGRLIGNHHLGTGSARDVDVLKGVNMAFRADALALPAPGVLRGSGAQVDFEVLCCSYVRQHGSRVVYDPSILVDHEGAPREGADQRVRPLPSAVFDAAFNAVVASCALEPEQLGRRGLYRLIVGSGDRPGVVRTIAAIARGEREVVRRAAPALAGHLAGILQLRRLRAERRVVVSASELRSHWSDRPRIALVAHAIHDHGGMERACAELIRHTHDQIAFTAVAAELSPDLRPLVDRWIRVPVPRRPFPLKFVAFVARAGLALRRLDVDLVHTVGAIVPNQVDVAAVHFCHAGFREATGALAPQDAPLAHRINTSVARALALAAERWCYRPSRLRELAAVSGGVDDELRQHYPGIPVVVTPNGIDPARFHPPDSARRAALRAEHGAGDDEIVALFVGGDWHRKGLGLAVEAVAKARADDTNLVLWVVGTGDEAGFGAAASALGVGERVWFFGPSDRPERFFQAADLFVLPSTYETFGIVCFEAAACGLPVVAPPLHGISDLIGDGEAGIVVERDADSIAAALRQLADPATRARLGGEAHRRARQYTWERSAASVLELYRSLLPQEAP